MRQYQALKERYPGALLFFRLGDFFELFGEDAALAARELDLVLTSRDGQIPMCGVPHHALDTYLGRLMEKGYRVALADQMESAEQAKGLVRREVVRLVTPATWIEGQDDKRAGLAAVATDSDQSAVAWVEPGAGRFEVTLFDGPQHRDEARRFLERLAPDEWLTEDGVGIDLVAGLSPVESGGLPPADAAEVALLVRLVEEAAPAVRRAAKRAADYLLRTHPRAGQAMEAAHLSARTGQMEIDPSTWRHLEVTRRQDGALGAGTLLHVLDDTLSAGGRRVLAQWLEGPLTEIGPIRHRQEAVAALVSDTMLRAGLRRDLAGAKDAERIAARAAIGLLTPTDLRRLESTLAASARVQERLRSQSGLLAELGASLAGPVGLAERIGQTVVESAPAQWREGGFIKDGVSAELDRLRGLQQGSHRLMMELEQRERAETGIRNLKVGYNRIFGYYLEVARSQQALVPPTWQRRQTVASGERYVNAELKALEESILGARQSALAVEFAIFEELSDAVLAAAEALRILGRALGSVDALQSLAEVAVRRRYRPPSLVEEPTLSIMAGRHPVVEASQTSFVPNDLVLDEATRLVVLTGPNMGGKSTYLRQAALIVLMAQIGSFVPAKEATVGVVDRLFSRIGSGDDLAGGRSTFFMEMEEVAHILRRATERSLVLLDEVGRGTSTYDGIAVAQAVVERLHVHNRCRALVATHFLELTSLSEQLPGIGNAAVTAIEQGDRVVFLRKVVAGAADRSYGVHVAGLAGVPETVLSRARRILEELEVSSLERQRWDRAQLSFALHEPVAKERSAVVARLLALDPNTTTPLQALELLAELRRLAEEES